MGKRMETFSAYLVKDNYSTKAFREMLKADVEVNEFDVEGLNFDEEVMGFDGKVFVKKQNDKKPQWSSFLEDIVGQSIDELFNRSSSAVLFIKSKNKVVAFTFGYGNSLLDLKYFVHDFGIKTALNTLQPDSLRGIDLLTLDDNAVQSKIQAARLANISEFGIDVSTDILRGVTGTPKNNIDLKSITGRDYLFTFTTDFDVHKMSELVDSLVSHYQETAYTIGFSWVDNIKRINDREEAEKLNQQLVKAIATKSSNVFMALPVVTAFEEILGFSFTRKKENRSPILETKNYYQAIDNMNIDIELLKKVRLFVFNSDGEIDFSVFNCIYFEHNFNSKQYILFSGVWYEIDLSFIRQLNDRLSNIPMCLLPFPDVLIWSDLEAVKKGGRKMVLKLEDEGNYNERVSKTLKYYLLDKMLIKSTQTTSPIEVCDLLTGNSQFIHVKHRKGNSAGLSHLFAQGSVSADLLLGDKEFRKSIRRKIGTKYPQIKTIIPLNKVKSNQLEIVFLILGEGSSTLIKNLPFFSKINLANTYESLTLKGFKVSVAGAQQAKFTQLNKIDYLSKYKYKIVS